MDIGVFDGWGGIARVAVRALVLYAYTVALVRIAGKRTTMTATSVDFVANVALGTLIASTILSPTIALAEGLLALTAIVLLQTLVAFAASRSDRIQRLVVAPPRLVYGDGRVLGDSLRAERISRQQLEQKLRAAGYGATGSVRAAVLESDGTVSVVGAPLPPQPSPDSDLVATVRR